MIEATCDRCGQTFNPGSFDAEDLEHWSREDGTECGGQGIDIRVWSFGVWVSPEDARERSDAWNHPRS